MLALVLAHRHELRAVEKNVGGHEHRVGVQPGGRVVLPLLGRFVLELRHPAGLAVAGDALHDPAELRMLRHVGLQEHHRTLGIDSGGEQLRSASVHALAKLLRIPAGDCDRVQIRDEVERVVIVLQTNPLSHRTEVVAEVVRIARGLDARQDALFLRRRGGWFSHGVHSFTPARLRENALSSSIFQSDLVRRSSDWRPRRIVDVLTRPGRGASVPRPDEKQHEHDEHGE